MTSGDTVGRRACKGEQEAARRPQTLTVGVGATAVVVVREVGKNVQRQRPARSDAMVTLTLSMPTTQTSCGD